MPRPWYKIAYLRIYVAVLVTLRRLLLARPVEFFWVGCCAFLLIIGAFYTVDLLPIFWLRSEVFSFAFVFYMTTCIVISLSCAFFALYRLIRRPVATNAYSSPRTQNDHSRRAGWVAIKSTIPWCCGLVILSWLIGLSPLATLKAFGWFPIALGMAALIVSTVLRRKRG